MSSFVAEGVLLGVAVVAPWLLLALVVIALPRMVRARIEAGGDELADKVRTAVNAAVDEAHAGGTAALDQYLLYLGVEVNVPTQFLDQFDQRVDEAAAGLGALFG